MKKVLLIILALLMNSYIHESIAQKVNQIDIDRAILFSVNEKWDQLNEFLDSIPENDPNAPVLKMLKGHACLALNENDLSFCYFLNMMYDSLGLQKWHEFSEQLTKDQPKSPVAFYFCGDAYARIASYGDSIARVENFNNAIAMFSESIELDSKFYLSYNSRGVAKFMIKEYNGKLDLKSASKIKSDFADVFNNLGNRTMEIMDAAESGIKYYSQSSSINQNFSLAYLGMGCLNVVVNNPINEYFELSVNNSLCRNPFFINNFDSLIVITTGDNQLLLSEIINNPGMNIETKYQSPSSSQFTNEQQYQNFNKNLNNYTVKQVEGTATQRDYNKVVSSYGKLSQQYKDDAGARINNVANKFPEVQNGIQNVHGPVVDDWNKNGSNIYKDVTSATVAVSSTVGGYAISGVPGAGVGAAVNQAYDKTINKHWETTNNRSLESNHSILNSLPKNTLQSPGGVSQSYSNSYIDSGNWPFIPCYGLLYNFYLIKNH